MATPHDRPDSQINVEHFIPSVTLKGTRKEKLRSLDALLAHLLHLRVSLTQETGNTPVPPTIQRLRTQSRATWRDLRVATHMLGRQLIGRVHAFFTQS